MVASRTKPPLALAPEDRTWWETLRRSRTAPVRQMEQAEILVR